MERTARERGTRVRIGAAVAAAIEVPESHRVPRRRRELRRLQELERLLPHVGPEAQEAREQRDRHEGAHQGEDRGHHAVREHGVERALRIGPRSEEARRTREDAGEREEEREAERGREADHRAVLTERAPEPIGPRVLAVGFAAHLREHAREVELELVRRRVLAGVEAGAAVVAEVGEVVHVAFGEFQAPLERREHRAVALAVAAGVADREDALRFGDECVERHGARHGHDAQPPRLQSGRTWSRSPCRCRRRIPCRARCPP
jgi:hypothetical protein